MSEISIYLNLIKQGFDFSTAGEIVRCVLDANFSDSFDKEFNEELNQLNLQLEE